MEIQMMYAENRDGKRKIKGTVTRNEENKMKDIQS